MVHKKTVAMLAKVEGIEKVKEHEQGGDVDTTNLVLKVLVCTAKPCTCAD